MRESADSVLILPIKECLAKGDMALEQRKTSGRLGKQNKKMLLKNGDYGFLRGGQLPQAPFSGADLPLTGGDWAVTSDYAALAHNHCAAVCLTNLALYFAADGPGAAALGLGGKDEVFRAAHRLTGNGPVLTVAGKATRYFAARGCALRHRRVWGFGGLQAAIAARRPCGVLLAGGLADWHWVLAVGWRQYADGRYLRIVDGWHNTADRFYKLNAKALCVAATQYWLAAPKTGRPSKTGETINGKNRSVRDDQGALP